MREIHRIALASALALIAGPMLAPAVTAESGKLDYLDRLPPLLEREIFFGDPEITASRVSPDGRHMTFQRPYEGVMNIWIKPLDAPFDDARPLTSDERPVPGYFWSMDSEYVLYVQDKGGNENFHVYAVDPDQPADESTGVPPSRDLTPLLNSIPPYWGPIRKLFTRRMGDPETEEGRAPMKRQSPLFDVDNIAAPLLVIQGANDPRVKKAESDQIVVAMREKELPVEYIVAPDEGHGFRGRANRMAMFARIEQFLAEHNGGRYQPDMAGDIGERLSEITVDIESVEKPARGD